MMESVGKVFSDAAWAIEDLTKALKAVKAEIDKKPFYIRWWWYYWPPHFELPSCTLVKFWLRWNIYWPARNYTRHMRHG